MKKILLLILCICTVGCTSAQTSTTSQPPFTREAYLQKSKKLWRSAIIVVSAGGTLAITGIIVGNARNHHYYNDNNSNTGAVLFIAGCAVMLSSICFSIPAHINKKKAMRLAYKNEMAPMLLKSMVFSRPVPSLSLKISL